MSQMPPALDTHATQPGQVRVLPRPGGMPFFGADKDQSTIALLDLISFVMERWVQIPGTKMRIGLNSVLLLLPIVGDMVTNLISVGILSIGLSNYRVPRIVAARMMLNTLIDASVGWIPVFGDVFDLFFKADTRNVRLLQEYIKESPEPPRSAWRHWAFVLGLFTAIAVIFGSVVGGIVALVFSLRS